MRLARIAVLVTACMACVMFVAAQENYEPRVLPVIPGITAPDKRPHGCVDCHKNHPERKMDHRLSTTLAKWNKEVDPERLKMAQAAAHSGIKLTGQHPDISSKVEVIPGDCLKCHRKESKTVPPFGNMMHSIHLVGGKDNHFIAHAQGSCTHCHKLDKKTGAWHLGSGKEE